MSARAATLADGASGREALPRLAEGATDGTQAIRRAVAALRVVASYRRPGASLTNIAEAMGLSRSTTHRILKCLVDEGLLAVDEREHRYNIGRLAYELSLNDLSDHHSTAAWSSLAPTIARKTGHTTYLIGRTGSEAVCLQRHEGHALIRASPVEVGQRRPLGVGAGGIALLAQFDEHEIRQFANSIGAALRPFPNITPQSLLADALRAKERAFAVSAGRVFSEVFGVAVTLPAEGRSRLAVSVTAPSEMVNEAKAEEVAAAMRREIMALSR